MFHSGQIFISKDKKTKLILVPMDRMQCRYYDDDYCGSDCRDCGHYELISCKGCALSKSNIDCNCYAYVRANFGIKFEPSCDAVLGDSIFKVIEGGL